MNKLYKSKKWLTRKRITEGLTQEEIAKLCGTTVMTISRYLRQFGIK